MSEFVKVISTYPNDVNFPLSDGTIITIKGVDRTLIGVTLNGTTTIKKEYWDQIKKEFKDNSLIKGEFINAVGLKDNTKDAVDIDEEMVNGVDISGDIVDTNPKKAPKKASKTS